VTLTRRHRPATRHPLGGDITERANPATVTMSANRSVSAVFTSTTPMFALATAASRDGRTVADRPRQDEYAPGRPLTLTAAPAAGYESRGEGDLAGTANPAMRITMDAGKSVVAVFTPTTYYAHDRESLASNGRTVARSPTRPNTRPGRP